MVTGADWTVEPVLSVRERPMEVPKEEQGSGQISTVCLYLKLTSRDVGGPGEGSTGQARVLLESRCANNTAGGDSNTF